MLNIRFLALVIGVCLLAPALYAEPPDEEAIHEELRAVRKGMIDAYNKNDIERLLSYCHENVIVIWQNGEVTVGPEGIREYYQKMMEGPNPIVASLSVDPTVDDLSVIYDGTTSVSRGQMNDHYELTDGMNFGLNSRWSATAVKQGDRWLIASFHASPNVFDNGVLTLATRQTMLWTGGIAVLVGLVVGAVATRLITNRQQTTT